MKQTTKRVVWAEIHMGIMLLSLLTLVLVFPMCSSKQKSADENNDIEVETLTASAYTYVLTQSSESLPLWTTPATRRVSAGTRSPDGGKTASGLLVSAARNEFEPVQLILGAVGSSVNVKVAPFPDLGAGQRIELAVAAQRDGWAEELTPVANGNFNLDKSEQTVLWTTVYVPADAPAGNHETTLTLTRGDTVVDVPLRLYVYDFELPASIGFSTQLNLSISGLMKEGETEEDVKTMLFEHRMTPKSVTWPSGFNWGITWDNAANPEQCTQFYDEPDEGDAYSIGVLGPKYVLGAGWNGEGFPNAMLFQFVDNSTPRPDSFCGIARGEHAGTDDYNAAYGEWLAELSQYLGDHGMLDKGYYYVQNEPQDAEDEALAAHLCRLIKEAAPDLRIAISEEPKPAIAEDAQGGCGYDIWIAHVRAYEESYAHDRIANHQETVWFYSLDHDPDPYFNPTTMDNQGVHQRIIPWVAWSHRIRGWAYYDMNRFFYNGYPGVRAELFREGFEDYEYLLLANGSNHPQVVSGADAVDALDETVRSVAASMTSFTKDADALMTLRHELGLYIEGTRDTLPRLTVDAVHDKAAYYINFQDPDGAPMDDPLVVDGNTYLKVGWNGYDEALGYGWYGENLGTDIVMTGMSSAGGFNAVQQSYVYDDYGRDNLFEFSIAPGNYQVTVGVGMAGRAYEGQPHNVLIEGQRVVDDEPTTADVTLIERSVEMEISDGSLSMVVAGRSASIDDYSYTFLSYLHIVPVD